MARDYMAYAGIGAGSEERNLLVELDRLDENKDYGDRFHAILKRLDEIQDPNGPMQVEPPKEETPFKPCPHDPAKGISPGGLCGKDFLYTKDGQHYCMEPAGCPRFKVA